MKLVLGLLVLCGVGAVVAYYNSYQSFDPSKQGQDARAAINPGMPFTEVLEAAGEPLEYCAIHRKVRKQGKLEIEYFEFGPGNKFKRQSVVERVGQDGFPHGFAFDYRFSNSVAFRVTFDNKGDVKSVDDLMTMADLLQTKD